ncbi:MAG: radical SAM family heme chaperone HemW [Desulfohalobiaceae bacterium]|nr:radical SAM family heme chaperone HemW [Desulfohalobiaceae bacterium]
MHLYVHVPFCRSKCSYCGFVSYPYDRDQVEAYLQALTEEIRILGKMWQRPKASTLFVGGGTPSLLTSVELERILRAIRDNFSVEPGWECTLEGNPESMGSLDYLGQLRSLGVNRVSLGLQSLDNKSLTFLNRRHSGEQGIEACRLAREAGFENLSVDLLWSVPGQDLERWLFELKTLADLGIRHMSCYALSVEPGTVLEELDGSGDVFWPSEEEQARMYLQGRRLLWEKGLKQYEISNFAAEGFVCRHNMGYWLGRDYLGFGPAAVSNVGTRRWKNPEGLRDYLQAQAGDRGCPGDEKAGFKERVNELLMLRLRTTQGLPLKEYLELTGRDLRLENRLLIRDLERKGLITCPEGRLCLTPEGMLVSDSLITRFFE